MDIQNSTHRTEKGVEAIVNLLNTKVDTLIESVVQRSDGNQVPVSVLKWIVIFLLIFNFAFIFGIPATEKMAHQVRTFFTEEQP